MTPIRCGISSKLQPLLQKTCISYASETLAACAGMCLCMHALARVCRPRPIYAGRGPLWSINFQRQIPAHLKSYIFHFNTSQVNLISNWALNWPWALEFEHHWGIGAQVVWGTKCGVYRRPRQKDPAWLKTQKGNLGKRQGQRPWAWQKFLKGHHGKKLHGMEKRKKKL